MYLGNDVSICGIEKKRNEVIKEFNDRVVLVLIQSIEGYLTKLDMK